ncbi:hypothetical protein CBL_02875 [Carabus blaptoides fortunei]
MTETVMNNVVKKIDEVMTGIRSLQSQLISNSNIYRVGEASAAAGADGFAGETAANELNLLEEDHQHYESIEISFEDKQANAEEQGKAHAKIAPTICDEQQMHIRNLTSPKNVWEELQRLYAPKDREINRTVADLSSIGDTIEDGDLAMPILCGLSDDWDTVVSSLCNLPEGDFKSATIKRRLLTEDARRRENTDSKSAMFLKCTKTSPKPNTQKSGKTVEMTSNNKKPEQTKKQTAQKGIVIQAEKSLIMRTYIKKTNRAQISENIIVDAIRDIKNGNGSLPEIAQRYGLKKSMLHKRIKKIKEQTRQAVAAERGEQVTFCGIIIANGNTIPPVYIFPRFRLKEAFLTGAADASIGITSPSGWMTNEGSLEVIKHINKFTHASKENPAKPENTSLARNISFNSHNVNMFYERGEQVTFCGIIIANGNTIPPVYIFPRFRFKEAFLTGAADGSIGITSPSGWMTNEGFLEVIKHINKFTHASKENPALILLDNHDTHAKLDVILCSRDNGLVLLTFPSHTTHRLQPLDVSVFGPFKARCRASFNTCMSNHPGKAITIYDIAHRTASAFNESFIKANILSGFLKTGCWPFNRNVFSPDDFSASQVTEIENNVSLTDENLQFSTNTSCSVANLDSIPSCYTLNSEGTRALKLTPEQVRPYPKVVRTHSNKGRKKKFSAILTNQKDESEIGIQDIIRKLPPPTNSKGTDSDVALDLADSSDCEMWEELPENYAEAKKDDFVVVKAATKKTIVYFIGKVITELAREEHEINFLRRIGTSLSFSFRQNEDISIVNRNNITSILPPAEFDEKKNSRTSCLYKFNYNFGVLNLK